MKIGHDNNLCWSQINIILDNIDKFMEGNRVDRAVRHDPLIIFQFEDSIIEIKDLSICEVVAVWPLDEVIPDLDDVVAEV